jgi:hypothetical protein
MKNLSHFISSDGSLLQCQFVRNLQYRYSTGPSWGSFEHFAWAISPSVLFARIVNFKKWWHTFQIEIPIASNPSTRLSTNWRRCLPRDASGSHLLADDTLFCCRHELEAFGNIMHLLATLASFPTDAKASCTFWLLWHHWPECSQVPLAIERQVRKECVC